LELAERALYQFKTAGSRCGCIVFPFRQQHDIVLL